MLGYSDWHDWRSSEFLIPANAGIQHLDMRGEDVWPPASAGATTHPGALLGALYTRPRRSEPGAAASPATRVCPGLARPSSPVI